MKELEELRSRIEALEQQVLALRMRQYIAKPPFGPQLPLGPFMGFSTCSAADFLHPRYLDICKLMNYPFHWHRKLWEWVFIIHHLLESGMVRKGCKGLVFGVGSERLPAVFASLGAEVLATDAPIEIGQEKGWKDTGQHASALSSIRYTDIVDADIFDRKVSYDTCDMNDILPELSGFDFNWSSCCFEHLGSLDAGMQIVVNAVEKTLREGGVAVHTTELNLSSDEETLEEGDTVIYRRRDIEELVRVLCDRGHLVKPFVIAPDSHYYDFYVDVPPYTHNPHLKLLLGKYVTTSVGLVVQRGPYADLNSGQSQVVFDGVQGRRNRNLVQRCSAGESLPFDSVKLCFENGWSAPESNWRWSIGKESTLRFSLGENEICSGNMRISCGTLGEQDVAVNLNGMALGSLSLSGTDLEMCLRFDPGCIERVNTVLFVYSNPRQPSGDDPRELAFCFKELLVT